MSLDKRVTDLAVGQRQIAETLEVELVRTERDQGSHAAS